MRNTRHETRNTSSHAADAAFTLLELLIALALFSVVSMVTYMTFSTALRAWRTGTSMTDSMHHGDYVMEQLVMGLRSMYYPDSNDAGDSYGFWHEDNGDGEDLESSDVISWVKLGNSLVGDDSRFVDSPHRVKFFLETDDDKGHTMVALKTWQLLGQDEEFDPEELDPIYLSRKVIGFDCRPAWQIVDDEIDWIEEWEDTNNLPTVVELTFYLEPTEEDAEPVKMTRIIGIPVGPRGCPRPQAKKGK